MGDDERGGDETREEEVDRLRDEFGSELLAAMRETFFWGATPPMRLLPGEMLDDPGHSRPLESQKPRPKPGYPFRALKEDEVRAFVRGIARMETNCWIENEKAEAARDPELECFYRTQAGNFQKVLQLLEMVLRGSFPGPGAQ